MACLDGAMADKIGQKRSHESISKGSAGETSGLQPPRKWNVRCGERASNILNPIRAIMDQIAGKENPNKKMISLAQGDPTMYPHLRPSQTMVDAVLGAVQAGQSSGYQPSQGMASCRAALAQYFTIEGRPALTPSDVFMTLGCSEALSHCIAALAIKGGNILLPRPGFCLYQVLCDYQGLEVRYYDLKPNQGWEVDLAQLDELADDKTCAILINNPSNPCGAVYSEAHLKKIMSKAEELCVPIISDEVYAQISFKEKFLACAAATTKVPVLAVNALSKRWLAPGWRLGWITVHDAQGIFAAAGVPETILKLCQVSLGPSALLQKAIPEILSNTPQEWYDRVLKDLRESAECCVRRIKKVKGIELTTEPQGAMYVMVKIKPGSFGKFGTDDVAFAGKLLQEESIAVLPGQCFKAPGFFRVVFAAPPATIDEAFNRIEEFCDRHSTKTS